MSPAEMFNISDRLKIKTMMVCTGCGAQTEAPCGCNLPYVPASERAAEAIKANPGKSDRVIAEEAGVSHQTVMRERKKSTGPHGPVEERTGSTGPHGPVEKRVGKDGKARTVPKPRAAVAPKAIDRERKVAELMDAGKSTPEIAQELGMKPRNVDQAKEHVHIAREAEAKARAETISQMEAAKAQGLEEAKVKIGQLEFQVHCLRNELRMAQEKVTKLASVKPVKPVYGPDSEVERVKAVNSTLRKQIAKMKTALPLSMRGKVVKALTEATSTPELRLETLQAWNGLKLNSSGL